MSEREYTLKLNSFEADLLIHLFEKSISSRLDESPFLPDSKTLRQKLVGLCLEMDEVERVEAAKKATLQ